MGWWSTTIMGGDSPLDYLSNIGGALGFGNENTWKRSVSRTCDILNRTPVKYFLDYYAQTGNDPVCAQVIAHIHMAVGAPLAQELRDLAIAACENEDVSTWREPLERKAHLTVFAEEVRSYDNKTPFETTEEGLFDAMHKLGASA